MTLKDKLETLPSDMYVEVQTNRRGEFFGGVASELLTERSDEVLNGIVRRADFYKEDDLFVYRDTVCDMFVEVRN